MYNSINADIKIKGENNCSVSLSIAVSFQEYSDPRRADDSVDRNFATDKMETERTLFWLRQKLNRENILTLGAET
jgi:hypothetical protein